MFRKTFLAASVAAAGLAAIGTAHAVPAVVVPNGPIVTVLVAPPAVPVDEAVPQPRAGHVWNPGHYAWRNGQYVWRHGHWMPARPGYEWQEARWMQRPEGGWTLIGGHWIRGNHDLYTFIDGDRDGDGIANAFDNDRDGDGIENAADTFASNPLFR